MSPGEHAALDLFLVFEEIGRGRSGVVHRACRKADGREVALKILAEPPPGTPRDVWLRRLRRESAVAARLDHPHIARVLALHEDRGRFLLELELVRGDSLRARLDRGGALPPAEALRLVEKLARALEHAHAQGVVHRDLKPENVVLDAEGEPRVIDFGVAKDLETATLLSQSGALIGTPLYLSPEQARGSVHDVDGRADVWALGVILYELLTGRPPFEGESILGLVVAICDHAPARPVLPDGRDAGAAGAVALAALTKDRHARPTAAELARACARARRSRGPSRRVLVGVGALLGAGALVSGGALALVTGREPPPPPPASREPTPAASDAVDLVRALETGLARSLPALEQAVARLPARREALAQAFLAWPQATLLERFAADARPTRDRLALADLLALLDGKGLAPETRGPVRARRAAVVSRLDAHVRRHLERAATLRSHDEERAFRAALDLLWQRVALEPELDGPTAFAGTALLGAAALTRLPLDQTLEVEALFLEAGFAVSPFLVRATAAEVLASGRRLVAEHPGSLGALLAAWLAGVAATARASASEQDEARRLLGGEPRAWLASFRAAEARSSRAGSPSLRQLRAVERFEWALALELGAVTLEHGTEEAAIGAALEAIELGHDRSDRAHLLAARAYLRRAAAEAADRPRAFEDLESAVAHARAAHAFLAATEVEHARCLAQATGNPEARLRLVALDACRVTAILGDPYARSEPFWLEAEARRAQRELPGVGGARELAALHREALERCVATAPPGSPRASLALAHVLAEAGEAARAVALVEAALASDEQTYWQEDPARRAREKAFADTLRARLGR